jgi:alkylation response protein AidB-like acyl-CoA dehydrogenase
LEEAAKFNEGVLESASTGKAISSPTSSGKMVTVTAASGFKEAFTQYTEAGWQGLQHPVAYGGQGLPKTIGSAVGEMQNSANMSFALCPLLTDGAIEALADRRLQPNSMPAILKDWSAASGPAP